MHPFPHRYMVSATASPSGSVPIRAGGLPELSTDAPREFDGPGDQWSPEALLCAAVADCFILSFRAIARASKFEWSELSCEVEGVLERAAGVISFTGFTTKAQLRISPDSDAVRARVLMEKAEHSCLVANSLRAQRTLVAEVIAG